MFWACLLAVAHAGAPGTGALVLPSLPSLVLRISPEAEVELLPASLPGQAEILVRRNRVDLRAQVSEAQVDGVRAGRASDLGGVWLVVLALDDDATHLRVDQHGATLVAEVVAGSDRGFLPHFDAPSVETLLAGKAEAAACVRVRLPLEPLAGAEMTYGMDAADFVPSLPRWTKAEPATTDWEQVSMWRERTWVARTAKESAYFSYKLGALFRNLGHAREAAYYFAAASESGGGGWEIPIQRAAAWLSVGRYTEAAQAADAAWRMGAPDDAVLEVLGVVSLATGSPPRSAVGRALAVATARPEPLFLAGALMLQDTCPADAQAALAAAVGHLPPERAVVARLMLTDAYIASGNLKDAALALANSTGGDADAAGLRRARSRLLALLRQSPETWSEMIPLLDQAASTFSPEGAESLHLLAQVHLALGDDRSAIEAWSLLLLRHRLEPDGVPGHRLLEAFLGRLDRLLAQGRAVDAVSLYQAIWRPDFLPEVHDPETLRAISATFVGLGLPGKALAVIQDVWAIEGRDGLDDRATTLTLARLYGAVGDDGEALETIRFLRSSRRLDPAASGELSLIEGRVRKHRGDLVAAREAFVAAGAEEATAAAGHAERAVLDAEQGDCAAAIPDLAAAVQTPEFGTPANLALLSYCYARQGAPGPAALAAREASEGATDPGFRAWIGWVADRLAGTTTEVVASGATPESAGMWERLRAENRAQSAFESRLSARDGVAR